MSNHIWFLKVRPKLCCFLPKTGVLILLCTPLYLDVALVEVKEELVFNQTILPVCLPSKENSNVDYYKREKVTIVGFGPPDGNSRTMQQISQRIRPYRYCKRKIENAQGKLKQQLGKSLPNGFENTLLCAQNW